MSQQPKSQQQLSHQSEHTDSMLQGNAAAGRTEDAILEAVKTHSPVLMHSVDMKSQTLQPRTGKAL